MFSEEYIPINMTDHEFSYFMRDKGWDGKTNKIKNHVQFIVDDRIVAVVKYRSSPPIDRYIHIHKDELSKKEIEIHEKNCVRDSTRELLEIHKIKILNLVDSMLRSGLIDIKKYAGKPTALAKVLVTASLAMSKNDFAPIDERMREDVINLKRI